MGAVLVDEGRWPLVVVRWPAGVATDEQVDEMLRELARLYGRQHAVLYDAVRAAGVTSRQRMRFSEHVSRYDAEVRQWVVACAAVAPSLFVRQLINTVQWVAPSPCPFKAFADRSEAEDWLYHALRRAGAWRPSAESPH